MSNSPDRVGARAGRYEIVERVGSGAMGEVFRARDPELGRDVAIKLVRPGGDTPNRLLDEARAMAKVTHPNVIRVYDTGTLDGDVFLAMELVGGQNLTEWLESADRPPAEVLAALIEAGRGLAAAHRTGLVHRDVKPDNILIASDGRVLVTDFGLALAGIAEAAEGAVAETQDLVGTPAYLAPEQLESAAASPASDQYSFCVCLFEALSGERPFPDQPLDAMRDAKRDGAIAGSVRPAPIGEAIRRGLSPAPDDRFDSMEALIAALEPRPRSWARFAAVAGVALIAGAVGLWFALAPGGDRCDGTEQLGGAWDDPVRRAVESAFGESDLPYAKTSLATVSAGLDRYGDAWRGGFEQACAETDQALLDLRVACLDRRSAELAAVSAKLASGTDESIRGAVAAVEGLIPPAVCADVAALRQVDVPEAPETRKRVDAVRAELAECSSLHEAGVLSEALSCASAVAGRAGEVGFRPLTAEAELLVGRVAAKLRDWTEAGRAFDAALLAADAGNHHRVRAATLVEQIALAGELSRFESGHERAKTAEAVVEAYGGERLVGDLDFRRGQLAVRQGKLDRAQAHLDKALEQRAGSAAAAEPLYAMAIIGIMRRDYDAATAKLDRALKIQSDTLGPDHPAIGHTLHVRAQLLARTGKFDEAKEARDHSHRIFEAAYGDAHYSIAISLNAAAQLEIFSGQYAAAVPLARRAVEVAERASGKNHLDAAAPLGTLAAALNRVGKPAEALEIHQRTLAVYRATLGDEHVNTTRSMLSVAMGMRLQRRCRDALPLLEKALAVRTAQLGAGHRLVNSVRHTLGDCHVDLGEADKAVPLLETVLASHGAREPRNANEKVALHMARYALARALWAAETDRDRAADLVRAAYKGLAELGDKRAGSAAEFMKKRGIRPK